MKIMNALKRKLPEEIRLLPDSFGERHVQITEPLDNGIFLTAQNALGCIYRLNAGIYDDPLTLPELALKIADYEKLFRQILPGIPFGASNVVIQVICSQREKKKFDYIEPVNDMAQFLSADERFVTSKGVVFRTIYIAVLMEKKSSFWNGIRENLEYGWTDDEFALLDSLEVRRTMFDEELGRLENETDLSLTRLTCEEALAYYNSVLNYGEECPVPVRESEFHSFKEQVFNRAMVGTSDGCYDAGDPSRNIKVFNFTHMPDRFPLGRLKTFLTELPRSWDFVWTISEGKIEQTPDMLARRMWFALGPSYKAVREDFDSFLNNIGPLKPFGKVSLKLLAYNLNESIERTILKYAVQYLSVPIALDDRLGPAAIASALPLNCRSANNAITGRYRTMRLAAALGFLPVFDGPKGKGFRIVRTNRGFEVRYDRFAGEANRITISLGGSSAGKSVANGFDIMEFKARFPDGYVEVIDQKTSSDRLVALLGGKLNKYTESYLRTDPLSPFAIKDWDDDDIELVCSFLAASIVQFNPHAEFGSSHTEILVEALKMCVNDQISDTEWASEPGSEGRQDSIRPHFTWMEVMNKLEPAADQKGFSGSMGAVDQLRNWTIPMTKTGQFGFLFSAHEKPSDDRAHRFIVNDLAGITDKRLQAIVAQLVALKMARNIKRLPGSVQKLIVFEELGVYLRGENAVTQELANNLVTSIVKTVRKSNGIPHGITNQVEDFFDTAGGRAFWNLAMIRIFLPMTDAMIKTLREKASDLNEADLDIIQSLRIRNGEYTQIYIIINNGLTKIKLIIEIPMSPRAGALYMTEGSMRDLYEKYQHEGHSVQETLELMAQHLERKKS